MKVTHSTLQTLLYYSNIRRNWKKHRLLHPQIDPQFRSIHRSTFNNNNDNPSPRSTTHSPRALADNTGSKGGGVFPAGKRQARVEIPALFISISAADISPSTLNAISSAVAGGATAIILSESSSRGAAQLYESAIAVKTILQGRAMLLISDRIDIVDAVGAQGVLLSPDGLPTVVVKDMLQGGLCLVGRSVENTTAATTAAADGANFILIQPSIGGDGIVTASAISSVRQGQRSGQSVPLLVHISSSSSSSSSLLKNSAKEWLDAGLDGLIVPLNSLLQIASAITTISTQKEDADIDERQASADLIAYLSRGKQLPSMTSNSDISPKNEKSSSNSSSNNNSTTSDDVSDAITQSPPPPPQEEEEEQLPVVAQLSQVLNTHREEIIAAEKHVLAQLIKFLQSTCPSIEEVSLLEDAVVQLDELFLLVVVGEFNSGKSAVINALLGRRVLAEGILPTTNEISVLKWNDTLKDEQTADGLFIRYIPADLLKEVNVVDTPGTNVILNRQQRLTEEFVPRADLVLFVLSSDRPFTDSEVKFLRYIKEWGKKVVFVVNKADLLSGEDEIRQVTEFVRDNAKRLLGVDDARVIPVSARQAAEAKLSCRAAEGDVSTGSLTIEEQRRLAGDSGWIASQFENLESFVRDFLLGGASNDGRGGADAGSDSDDYDEYSASSPTGMSTASSTRGESVRLKLRTPLFVAEALISAARTQLLAEIDVIRADAASVSLVRSQLSSFQMDMEKEGKIQQEEVTKQVASLSKAASDVIDSTLQLSNWETLSSYILGPGSRGDGQLPVARRFRSDVPREAASTVEGLVKEHSLWIESNCRRQIENYNEFASVRARALGRSLDELVADKEFSGNESSTDIDTDNNGDALASAETRRRWRQLRDAAVQSLQTSSPPPAARSSNENTLGSVASLDPKSTELMLEQEVREAVLSTASTTAGAGAFGIFLTSILPTTMEDLLALGLSTAIGYASILNLPLRRAEAKKKIDEKSSKIIANIKGSMSKELYDGVQECQGRIMALIEPLEALTAKEVEKAEHALDVLEKFADDIALLQKRAADVN